MLSLRVSKALLKMPKVSFTLEGRSNNNVR